MYRSFGITLEEMLSLDILKNAKILAGADGLNKRVTKVNVMEVPDILDWVAPGEFLLTTAYSIKDDIRQLNDLIPKLSEKGLAGIGIKTKRYVKKIPENILSTANKLNFPVIDIPFDISHTDIITPVLTEIINNQANTLLKIDNMHSRLMNVMLKGGSLKEIAKAINESIHNTIAIYDGIFETYEMIGDEGIKSEIYEIIERESNKKLLAFSNNKEKTHLKGSDIIKGREISRIIIPIYTEDRLYGYIFIWEDKKTLTPVELTVIEASTSVIALDLVKKLSIFEIENKHKIEFFEDLLSSDENRQKKALERAAYFDFDNKLNYSIIVVTIKDIDKLVKLTPINTNYLHQLNNKLLNIIERLSRYLNTKILYGNKSDRIIILFGSELNDREEMKKMALDFSSKIFNYARRENVNEDISIGIGKSYKDAKSLWKSYREATRAAENLNGNNKSLPIHYDDLGIYRILSYEELQPELFQFYKETLEPLVNYDREKDSDLVKTLHMYFECGGNLKRISQEMYTHYNTIIYRMQRIKEITGVNLEDANERLNIQIALKIYDIYKHEI